MAKGILKKTSSESTATASKKISLFGDKNDRHDLLIAEFKQAHRRMFAASSGGSDASGSESDSGRGNGDNDIAEKSDANKAADSAPPAPARDNGGEKSETKNPGSLSVDNSVETIAAAAVGSGKPKAPPPPPPVKKSRLLLSAQLSSSSSESLLSGRSMSTFKPDRYVGDTQRESRVAMGGGGSVQVAISGHVGWDRGGIVSGVMGST